MSSTRRLETAVTSRSEQVLGALAGLFPEVMLALACYDVLRDRVRGRDPERGDAVQWVILVAIGVAMAVTVGTVVYTKVRDKAATISTDTPPANTGP